MSLRSFGSTGSRVWPALYSNHPVAFFPAHARNMYEGLRAVAFPIEAALRGRRRSSPILQARFVRRKTTFGLIAKSNGNCRAGARYGATTVASVCDACISRMPLGPSTKRNEAAISHLSGFRGQGTDYALHPESSPWERSQGMASSGRRRDRRADHFACARFAVQVFRREGLPFAAKTNEEEANV